MRFTVADTDTALALGSGDVAVLATPRLLAWLEASARVAGAQRIRVEARRDNVPARTFYNELGYHEVAIRRGRYSDGVDGVVLEKWLQARAA